MLPTRIRNPEKPELKSGALLIIADTRKEIELGLSPYFSQQMLGKNEVMAS